MSLILSIETSQEKCSVAVHKDYILLASASEAEPRSHAAKLAILIQEVIQRASCSLNQLSAVAVSAGPGSYTGLRIGSSTAKGLCYALGIPLIAINTLDVLIAQVMNDGQVTAQLLCPMIDARRMEVYCKIIDGKNFEIQEMKAVVVNEHTFTHLLEKSSIHFFGSGALKCKQVISHPNAKFSDVYPEATAMGKLAFQKLTSGEIENSITFEPVYLKEFQTGKDRVGNGRG
jgi:tRNA threonylcarbamoyladenosine biosynthesis protein TsaB